MKRLRLWLALLFASICSLQGAYALDIKEPVLNLEELYDTLVVDKWYYLCNVKSGTLIDATLISSGNYICKSGNSIDSLITCNPGGDTFKFSSKSGGYVSYNTSTFLNPYSKYTGLSSTKKSWYVKCVDKDNKFYTISYYQDSCYIGFNSGDSLVNTFKNTDDNIKWRLVSWSVYYRYERLKRYYNLLKGTNTFQQGFLQEYIDKYKEFYNDPNSTGVDIDKVYSECNKMMNRQKAISSTSEGNMWIGGTGTYDSKTKFNLPCSERLEAHVFTENGGSFNFYISKYYYSDGTQYVGNMGIYYGYIGLKLYIDGQLIRDWSPAQMKERVSVLDRFYIYEKIPQGNHKIELEAYSTSTSTSYTSIDINYFRFTENVVDPITVNLLEPGSLGTEVLYHVDHLKDMKTLKIVGKLNSDDWSKINMMTGLTYLDLSDIENDHIPASQFSGTSKLVVLPKKLKSIGESAFEGYSRASLLDIPETVENIGKYAFRYSTINKIKLPNIDAIGERAFYQCTFLEDVSLGGTIDTIQNYTFYECHGLKEIELPETLVDIRPYAFYKNSKLEKINGGIYLPKSLKSIQGYAFQYCSKLNMRFHEGLKTLWYHSISDTAIDSLIIPESIENIGCVEYDSYYQTYYWNGFNNLPNLTYIEFPTNYHKSVSFKNSNFFTTFEECPNVNTVVFKSPTIVTGDIKKYLFSDRRSSVTLRVPEYLVNAYKLDEYWYNFKIEGFSTELVKNWEINSNLTLYARDRFKGNPNIKINAGLNILGEDGMDVDTLTLINGSRFISHNDGVKINGELYLDYTTTKNTWYFISLPFNIKVSDIVPGNGGKYAIRYYDGANRAQNGTGGNWKNYEADDIIEAGTGFIYQTSVDGVTRFIPADEESKQFVASNEMFVKALEANPSEYNSRKGWNFIGNPWQAYFNNHSLNFTAPITVWNGTTYVAYSLIDDDYAIRPNQAFFVQCPEEINSISFPITGRQLTSVITNQSGAKPRMFGANLENRQLIDLSVAKGDLMDKTRLVVNEGASADYETGVDASKFFSMDGAVPQVYTLVGEATECAINERPVAEGLVKVGFMAPEDGSYTFALVRNEAKTVMLIDHETGTTTDLTAGEYNFTAAQGTWNNRFELMITPAEPTAIEGVDGNKDTKVAATDEGIVVEGTEGRVVVYSVDGKKVAEQPVDGTATISVAKGTYLVRTAKGTAKVTVR